jgi:hypothetical protein
MLEQIKFENHIKESMDWGSCGIYVNYNDLHDYSWNYTSDNNKISAFNKGIVKKSIPVIIACSSEEEGIAMKNRLLEICEKDVLAMQHGKIVIGDYFLKCFITGSKKKKYLMHKGYLETTLTLTTDFPQWVKESTVTFGVMGSGSGIEEGKRNFDFNFDFPFDYASEMTNKKVNNTGFVPSNFKLVVYGACINPSVHIAGHTYQVNVEVGEGEYLTIDSLEKTIILTKYDGTTQNCFNNRNRDSYIFEKIPSGDNVVTWEGNFGFDVILLEERSEPKWT